MGACYPLLGAARTGKKKKKKKKGGGKKDPERKMAAKQPRLSRPTGPMRQSCVSHGEKREKKSSLVSALLSYLLAGRKVEDRTERSTERKKEEKGSIRNQRARHLFLVS